MFDVYIEEFFLEYELVIVYIKLKLFDCFIYCIILFYNNFL